MEEQENRIQEHIAQLYTKYYDELVLYCISLLSYQSDAKGRAEECVQEAFLVASKKYNQLSNHPDIKSWLYKTCQNKARNAATTYRRHKAREGMELDRPGAVELSDPVDAFERLEEAEVYQDTLKRIYTSLRESQHMVFREYYEKNQTIKEIHIKHGIPEGTIKTTLRRIREQLKKINFSKIS